MKNLLSFALLFILSAACTHKKVMLNSDNSAMTTEKDSLNPMVIWIKNKSNSIDIQVRLYNGYEDELLLKENSWTLTYNGEKVSAVAGMNELNLRSQGTYERVLVFPFPKVSKEREGEVILDIDPIIREKDSQHIKAIQIKLPLKIVGKTGTSN